MAEVQRAVAIVGVRQKTHLEYSLRCILFVNEVQEVVSRVVGHGPAGHRESIDLEWTLIDIDRERRGRKRIGEQWGHARIKVGIHAAESEVGVTHPQVPDRLAGERTDGGAVEHDSSQWSSRRIDGAWIGGAHTHNLDRAGGRDRVGLSVRSYCSQQQENGEAKV